VLCSFYTGLAILKSNRKNRKKVLEKHITLKENPKKYFNGFSLDEPVQKGGAADLKNPKC